MKPTKHHLAESHERQFKGEDYQVVAQDICDGIPGVTEEDFVWLSTSPEPGCDCSFCKRAEWEYER